MFVNLVRLVRQSWLVGGALAWSAALALALVADGCAISTSGQRRAAQPQARGQEWGGMALEGRFVPVAADGSVHPWATAQALDFAWSHSAAKVRFVGAPPAFEVVKSEANPLAQYYSLQLDTREAVRVALVVGQGRVALPADAPGVQAAAADGRVHRLVLRRESEAFLGAARLGGVVPGETTHLCPPEARPTPGLLVVGDSISAGYGNLGHGPKCPFEGAEQAASQTYGPMAAAQLGLEAEVVAWSGKGIWRNRDGTRQETMADLWMRALPEAPPQKRGAAMGDPRAVADIRAVVVNLGTNDAALPDFDEAAFAAAHRRLWALLRLRHPRAQLVVAVGPMLEEEVDGRPGPAPRVAALLRTAAGAAREAGESDPILWVIPQDRGELGFGCDYHPSVARHRAMARQLADLLRPGLGREPPPLQTSRGAS